MLKLSKNTILILFSFLIILTKWIISYYFFKESLETKIIFESITDGKYYYTLIKFLSDLNLSYSFDPNVENLRIIQLPLGGIIWHAIFFKILGLKSFIILEFICLFVFLYIFTNLLNFIFNNNLLSIAVSIIIFLSPLLIKSLNFYDVQPLKIFADNIYNFRVPRPMVSNLYFFSFFLILVKMLNKNFFSYKYLIFIGSIAALSLSSFYYHFVIEVLTFITILFFKFKSKVYLEIKKNIKPILLSLSIFLIIVTPFLINLHFHETEYTKRVCTFEIGLDEKKILLKHIFSKIIFDKFIFLILILGISQIFINQYFKKFNNVLNVSFSVLISSIIAPIIFIILTNKTCVLYHFINLIILTLSIHLLLLSTILFKNINKKFKDLFFILITPILFSYYLMYDFNKNKDYSLEKKMDIERKEFQLVISEINKNFRIKESSILTFDTNLMIWSILNEFKYINLLNGLFTSKKDYMLENDLISSFKVLNQDEKNFYEFIRNKKENWRYMNHDFAKIFFYKYQANSLITYNDSKKFTSEESLDIKNSSPLLHQQSILPLDELNRLLKRYQNYNLLNNPDIIVLDKDDKFLDFKKVDYINHCVKFNGEKFILLFNVLKTTC